MELPTKVTADSAVNARCWEIISKRIDPMLDAFYRELSKSTLVPNLDVGTTESMKSKQKQHWHRLFVDGIDDTYARHIVRTHLKHQEIGIPTSFLISSYFLLLADFHQAVLHEAKDLAEARTLISAVNTVVSADITRALAIYCDAAVVD